MSDDGTRVTAASSFSNVVSSSWAFQLARSSQRHPVQ